ncbi:MAG: lipid II flippase MurJ [Candidatus Dojkabacteria bacterium]|nr:lipid II flippase MurJ [Candidatus Dojkabacteria bacterium]
MGGPASFNFAKSLYLVIPSIFGYTFSYASYPTLSRLFIEGNQKEIRRIVHKTLNEIFFLALPFVITLMVLRVPLVRLVFGIFPNTAFTLDNTYQVAWILLFFSFGLIFITARWFVFNLFYASKNTILPSIVSIFTLTSVIGLSILFTNLLSHNPNYAISTIDWHYSNFLSRADEPSRAGVAGISMAMSLVYSIELIIMLILFNRFKIGIKKLATDLSKKIVAGGWMLVFMYLTFKTWNVITYIPESADSLYKGSTSLNLFILTTVTVIPGFMIYYLICKLLRVEELKLLRRYLNPIFKIGGLRI